MRTSVCALPVNWRESIAYHSHAKSYGLSQYTAMDCASRASTPTVIVSIHVLTGIQDLRVGKVIFSTKDVLCGGNVVATLSP
jgi:hypothetical protein